MGIGLQGGRRLRALGEDKEGYNVLGALEADDVKHEFMKESLSN